MERFPNLIKHLLATATQWERRELEQRIMVLTDKKVAILSGALEIENACGMEDIVRVLNWLDNYKLYQDITTPAALGRKLVDTGEVHIHMDALPYVDFTRVANDFGTTHSGTYTKSGYVLKIRDGEPEPRQYIVKLELSSPRLQIFGTAYVLFLPASSAELDDAMAVLGVDSLEECSVVAIDTPYAELNNLPDSADIYPLNILTSKLEKIISDQDYKNFCAAIEVERPEGLGGLVEIASNIWKYDLFPRHVDTPEEYGRYVLYETNEFYTSSDDEFQDEVKDFIDYQSYGEYKMSEDGIRKTTFGWLRRQSEPFPEIIVSQDQGMNMSL